MHVQARPMGRKGRQKAKLFKHYRTVAKPPAPRRIAHRCAVLRPLLARICTSPWWLVWLLCGPSAGWRKKQGGTE